MRKALFYLGRLRASRRPAGPFLLLLALLSRVAPAAGQPAIFHANVSVRPGEALSLQGSFGDQARAYLARAGNPPLELPVLVQRAGQATVQVPASLGLDAYEVWVVEPGGQRSPSVFVNQARGMHFDSPEVAPGGKLRLFGRNLLLAGSTPQVRFAPRGGGGGLATVDVSQSDAYVLALTAPASLVSGVTYDVFVSNGRGGAAGETLVERPLLAIAPGPDYFGLGVGWAAKLDFTATANVYDIKSDPRLSSKATGDGNTNDLPALQAAINQVGDAGGGIVYLPTGTYKLDFNGIGLFMRSRVVLQGAGRDQTTLLVGENGASARANAAGNFQNWTFNWNNARQAGLADLTYLNGSDLSTAHPYGNMLGSGTELFVQRCRFTLGESEWLQLAGTNKLAILNTELTQGVNEQAGRHGPLQLNEVANFRLAHNTITYAVDGLNMNEAHEGVFEDNVVNRNGNARYPITMQYRDTAVNHVLILNFTQNMAVLNNRLELVGGPAQDSNDGESIIAESAGGYHPDVYAGPVSRATTTTLQDDSKSWKPDFELHPAVAIVHGPGMGQWRTIASRSGTTLTVDRAWDVPPTSQSHYATFNWCARNWLVRGNTMQGNRRGITIYLVAATQMAIVDNTLTDNGSIDLSPDQNSTNGQQFYPMYDIQVLGNTVARTRPHNTVKSNGVFIGIHTVQYGDARAFGTSVIGLEVRRNLVTTLFPNRVAIVDINFPEGYENRVFYQPFSNYVDEGVPAVLGSIFQDNTAINCDNALHLSPASYNTLVCGMTLIGTPSLLSETPFDGVSHGSIGTTTTCPAAPLPVELTEFTARAAGPAAADAELTWRTASEYNNHYFEVERSPDGHAFVALGRVAGRGSAATSAPYAYRDAGAGQQAGRLYYRLRQVDFDGRATYSPVRAVAFGGAGARVSLYPNPAPAGAATLDLRALPPGDYELTLLDATGRCLRRFTLPAGQPHPLDLAGWPPGVYLLRGQGPAAHFAQRVVRE